MTCRAERPCEFELIGIELVGKTHEYKTEWVAVPNNLRHVNDVDSVDSPGRRMALKLVSDFCVDGWSAHLSDLFNHHRAAGRVDKRGAPSRKPPSEHTWQCVGFHRYV